MSEIDSGKTELETPKLDQVRESKSNESSETGKEDAKNELVERLGLDDTEKLAGEEVDPSAPREATPGSRDDQGSESARADSEDGKTGEDEAGEESKENITREELAERKSHLEAGFTPGSEYDQKVDGLLQSLDDRNLTEGEVREAFNRIEDEQLLERLENEKGGKQEWGFAADGDGPEKMDNDAREILEEQGRVDGEVDNIARSGFEHHARDLKEGDKLYALVPEVDARHESNAFWIDQETFDYLSERYPEGQEEALQNDLGLPSQFNWNDVMVVNVNEEHRAVESTIAPATESIGKQSLQLQGGLQQITPDPDKISQPRRL